ncbi:MAG: hypothetical protein HY872_01135 [Chloroflexi bacterium]|nr:hypothetical protein [Chloroflexota bacterium]
MTTTLPRSLTLPFSNTPFTDFIIAPRYADCTTTPWPVTGGLSPVVGFWFSVPITDH